MYRITRERMRAARERLEHREPVRGTPEERARHQLDIYYDMKPLRDAATRKTLGFALDEQDAGSDAHLFKRQDERDNRSN
ncbi:hypothetical protein [Thermoactinomyces vulgaris]|jgi:hypothetical protein|uniref:hypothetical protein n=1 Tax=Thermoactinomyces vulgaris TaxID=2026 RepID=UPI0036333BC0